MNIVFFTHPAFQSHQSMPRFAMMLAEGMKARGHKIELWSPEARFNKLPVPAFFKKWLGYIDQYIIFPAEVRKRLKETSKDTLFVFTDQALGPWIPLVADRPHVIHCHDFLAQKSALGQIPQNQTSWSGKHYQAFIYRGYSKGKNFISVSEKTRADLADFLPGKPNLSEMVYNGLNQSFTPLDVEAARKALADTTGILLEKGYLLHVGGNQWYKNRKGVIEIYNAWRNAQPEVVLPLLLIGYPPNDALKQMYEASPYKDDIYFLTGLKDEVVRMAYAGASVFLFPSLAEGFGWPIAEAMASGCPVITTDAAPMTEVAGTAAVLIPLRTEDHAAEWADAGARAIQLILSETSEERNKRRADGLRNAERFTTVKALDKIEAIYQQLAH